MQSLLKHRLIYHILQLKPRELTFSTRTLYTAQRQVSSINMGLKTDFTLYTALTPNGIKVPILLEELGLEYKVWKNMYLISSGRGISSCLHIHFPLISCTMWSSERMSRNCPGFWTSIPMAGSPPWPIHGRAGKSNVFLKVVQSLSTLLSAMIQTTNSRTQRTPLSIGR